MSYGIWKKRGKGWSSIEIDTPGNGETLRCLDFNEKRYQNYVSRFNRILGHADHEEDLAALTWEANIREKHPCWYIASFSPGGGEHVQWIAFDCIWTLLSPKGPLNDLLAHGTATEIKPGHLDGWTLETDRGPIDLPETEEHVLLLFRGLTSGSIAHHDERRRKEAA